MQPAGFQAPFDCPLPESQPAELLPRNNSMLPTSEVGESLLPSLRPS
jgi:hypothetical protein